MDHNAPGPLLFSLSESHALAPEIGQEAQLPLADLEERRFEGGEFKMRPMQSVRGRVAYVFQSLAGVGDTSTSERLLRLLFLLNTLRDAGASQCVALIPYFAFARQEQRTQLRDPVNTRYVAQLLETCGADRIVALDVHNPAALDNAFRIPVDHLSALPMMVDHYATRLPGVDFVVVSPDIGGIKRAQLFREMLQKRIGREVELAFIEKRRLMGVVSGGTLVGNTAGRSVILLDDLCATGGTLLRAAEVCRKSAAAAIHVAVTHVPLAKGLAAVFAAGHIAGILTTDSVGVLPPMRAAPDTVPQKLVILSIAPLIGQALRRVLAGKPLAPLLERWPVHFEE
jgi:ribose-phosphate pyrophosphokinase